MAISKERMIRAEMLGIIQALKNQNRELQTLRDMADGVLKKIDSITACNKTTIKACRREAGYEDKED